MWGLDTFPGNEAEFECAVCGVAMFEDSGVCSNVCFNADQL